MRRMLFIAAVLMVHPAHAQAPAEDRAVSVDPVTASQQRLGALRSRMLAAQDSLKQAEQQAKEAASSFNEARSRNEIAQRELNSARREAAQSRKLYEQESIAFDRLRKGDPGTAAKP